VPDLLIPDLDQAVIERLEAAAKRRGITVGRFIAGMLDIREAGQDARVVDEIAAMRASQPRQESDAAEDVRRLRDGGDEPQDATQAA
jgi:hypothetical protein